MSGAAPETSGIDRWGCVVSASSGHTVDAWYDVISSYLGFRGDPVATAEAIEDPVFIRRPIFVATMKLLGGIPASDPSIIADLTAVAEMERGATPDERAHADALRQLAAGEVSAAALRWSEVAHRSPADVLALKCSHEAAFLVGDVPAMLRSSDQLVRLVGTGDATFHVVAGQHAFALEESGRFDEAEVWARRALEARDDDLWALHALAHVFETQHRHDDAMHLLEGRLATWSRQNLLSVHIWWHLGLRLIAAERFADAIELFDEQLAPTPADGRFRLTDGISLLWRLERAGVDVGNRWDDLADKWAVHAERHSNAFLDIHGALVFIRRADHPGAQRFFDSLDTTAFLDGSELSQIHDRVTRPIIEALRNPRLSGATQTEQTQTEQTQTEQTRTEDLLLGLHRIGGSAVQRQVVTSTLTNSVGSRP